MDRQLPVTESDYEPPLDKECGIMIVLETKEDVARFVAANRGEERNLPATENAPAGGVGGLEGYLEGWELFP